MQHVYSLVFFDCDASESCFMSAINGPFNFQCEHQAQGHLYAYAVEKIATHYTQYLYESAASQDVDMSQYADAGASDLTYDQAKHLLNEEVSVFDFDAVVSLMRWSTGNESIYFGYKIECLPTSSLIEQLLAANGLVINYCFIREFTIESETSGGDDDMYLTCTQFDAEFRYSFTELRRATYDAQCGNWYLGDDVIKPITT